MIRFVVLNIIAISLVAAKLPPNFSVCKKTDSNYNDCIRKAVENAIGSLAKGNKEFRFPKLEPLFVKDIHIAGNGGNIDLNQNYIDLNVFGLSHIKINKFDSVVDNKKCEIDFDAFHDSVSLIGSYKATGKMLLFQLNGFGALNITITQLVSNHKLDCKIVGEYLTVVDYIVSLMPGKIYFDIENLIDGNEVLSKAVLNVMNENAEEVFSELRKDYERTFSEIFKQITINIFGKIPIKEIF